MFLFSDRSRLLLHEVHPDLVLVVSRGLLYSDVDFAIIEGVRSAARQKQLYSQGHSRTLNSKHLLQTDGYGHAVDVMAVGDLDHDGDVDHQDKAITWNREWYSAIADAMYRASRELAIKIRWGGDFKDFFDGPHFELVMVREQ